MYREIVTPTQKKNHIMRFSVTILYMSIVFSGCNNHMREDSNLTIENNTTTYEDANLTVENNTTTHNAYSGIAKFINTTKNITLHFDENINSLAQPNYVFDVNINSLTQPKNGNVKITGTGKGLQYVSKMDFIGVDTFTYTIFGKTINVEINVSKRKENTYYIDATSGDNHHDGMTPKTAWQTIEKLNSTDFKAGDYVLLKSGEVYHQAINPKVSGEPNKPITIGAYGMGDKPVVTMMRSQEKLKWKYKENNVWSTKPGYDPIRVKKDGIEVLCAGNNTDKKLSLEERGFKQLGKKVPDLVECFDDQLTHTLYMYSSDSPSNHDIELPRFQKGVILKDKHDIHMENIEIIGGNRAAIMVEGSSRITLTNMTVGDFAPFGIRIESLTETEPKTNKITYKANESIVVDSCVINSKFTFNFSEIGMIGNKESFMSPREGISIFGAKNCIVKNSLIKNFAHGSLYLMGVATKRGGELQEGREVENCKVYNNLFTSPDIAYGGRLNIDGFASNNEIHHNLIIDTAVRSQLNGYNNHIHHNVFKGTKRSPLKGKSETGQCLSLQAYYTPVFGNIIENNLLVDCEDSGIQISGNNKYGEVRNNTIKNNIIYNAGKRGSNIGIEISPNKTNYNNTIVSNFIHSDKTTKTIKINHDIIDVFTFKDNK